MEIQQIKKEYITDRIRESVDVFGSQPECLGSIIMTAVMALALLISKVLDKARELSAKFFEKEALQMIAESSKGRTTEIISQTDKTSKQEQRLLKEPTANPSTPKRELQPQTQTTEQKTPQIPPKPVMSAEAAAYPKLLKIYKELNCQNGIIFDAERNRNELEMEHDNLKGLAKLTKKGELQSRIDRKNEEIDILKVGLSGIVKRYGFQTVHDFYKTFAVAKTANADYQDKADNWEKIYGIKAKNDTMQEKIQNLQRRICQQREQMPQRKDRGAR